MSSPATSHLRFDGFVLTTWMGQKPSSMLSRLWEGFNDKSYFFLMNFGLALAAALMLFFMLRWLKAVMREKNIH